MMKKVLPVQTPSSFMDGVGNGSPEIKAQVQPTNKILFADPKHPPIDPLLSKFQFYGWG
jgi:hypothetical protein